MSERTAYNWLRRYREEGPDGLQDRSSKPLHSPSRTADDTQAQVFALGRKRCIYDRIAEQLHISRATVGRILTRHGLNHWRDLEPAEPVIQYERAAPGEMVHIDIKKLVKFERVGHRITGNRQEGASRGAGWEFVHVCIDDHSRIAFPKAAVTWYQGLGIKVDRVMTDNGSCYRSKAFNKVCAAMGLRHIYTKPDRPKTKDQWQGRTVYPVIAA